MWRQILVSGQLGPKQRWFRSLLPQDNRNWHADGIHGPIPPPQGRGNPMPLPLPIWEQGAQQTMLRGVRDTQGGHRSQRHDATSGTLWAGPPCGCFDPVHPHEAWIAAHTCTCMHASVSHTWYILGVISKQDDDKCAQGQLSSKGGTQNTPKACCASGMMHTLIPGSQQACDLLLGATFGQIYRSMSAMRQNAIPTKQRLNDWTS